MTKVENWEHLPIIFSSQTSAQTPKPRHFSKLYRQPASAGRYLGLGVIWPAAPVSAFPTRRQTSQG